MRGIRTSKKNVLAMSLAMLMVVSTAWAGPIFDNDTMQISFQAFLTDDLGEALPDGTVDLSFTIYHPIVGPIEGPIELDDVPIAGGVVDALIPVSRSSFDGSARVIGVSVNGGPELSPWIPLVAVPHALRVDRVENQELTDNVELGDLSAAGSLIAYRASGTISLSLDGANGEVSTLDAAGQQRFIADATGTLQLLDDLGNLAGRMTSSADMQLNDTSIGFPSVYASGATGIVQASNAFDLYSFLTESSQGYLQRTAQGAELRLKDELGVETVRVGTQSAGGGVIELKQTDGSDGVFIDGSLGVTGGLIRMFNGPGSIASQLSTSAAGGYLQLNRGDGTSSVRIYGDATGDAGKLTMDNAVGQTTVEILAAAAANEGARINLHKPDGTATIMLNADSGGEGRITTQVLEITGGSDLSEQFDIGGGVNIEPGLVVSIDASRPGDLVISGKSYDRTVAGIVSGAGGVKPGMLMGQRGTKADGKHPVALTGRVYCWCDASNGAIEPGDLLTTSDVAGHAMKVKDHERAAGAIIGKAMGSLKEGRALVLVLVSLQ